MTKKLTILNFLFVVLQNRIQEFNVYALYTGNYIRNGRTNERTNQTNPIQSNPDQTKQTKPNQTKANNQLNTNQPANQPTKPDQNKPNQPN